MKFKNFMPIGFLGIFLGCVLGISACGSDSSSSSEEFVDDSSNSDESSSSNEIFSSFSNDKEEIDDNPITISSSNSIKKTETVSSNEILMEPQKKVNGSCGPNPAKIPKGEVTSWEFYRSEGEVYSQIVAPFVWKFTGAKTEQLQGNGLNSVNVRYENSGTFNASLNVDGNEVVCEPIQVQGIPITIKSCTANANSVKAGENISWEVEATSESKITGYSWSSTFGTVSGSTTKGVLLATADMHKQNVNATVAVTNADNTTETYSCESVVVINPESVDMILVVGNVNNDDQYKEPNRTSLPDSLFIPSSSPITVQIPSNANSNCTISCVPRLGSDYTSTKVTWDGVVVDNFAYFNPSGCAPGKKYSVESTVTTLCLVNP